MKKIICHFIVLTFFTQLCAQNGSITGQITDAENNDPLIGANVIVEGTNMGAATDVNGNYNILNVPVGTTHYPRSNILHRPCQNYITRLV